MKIIFDEISFIKKIDIPTFLENTFIQIMMSMLLESSYLEQSQIFTIFLEISRGIKKQKFFTFDQKRLKKTLFQNITPVHFYTKPQKILF